MGKAAETDEAKELQRIRRTHNIVDRAAGDGQEFVCPCKGMRCIDLANNFERRGKVAIVLEQLCEQMFAEVLSLCSGLSDSEHTSIISEWNIGNGALVVDLCNKLSMWQK